MGIAELILGLLQAAPAAISEIRSVYNAVKGDLSATDQATIDQALFDAQVADANATAAADVALSAAADE